MLSELELGFDQLFTSHHAQLLQACDLYLRERLGAEFGKGRAAPESKRLPEPLCPTLGSFLARLVGYELLETVDIHALGFHPERVPGRPCVHDLTAEQLPQL